MIFSNLIKYFKRKSIKFALEEQELELQLKALQISNEKHFDYVLQANASPHPKYLHIRKSFLPNPDRYQIFYIAGYTEKDEGINSFMSKYLELAKAIFWQNGCKLFSMSEFMSMTKEVIMYHCPDADSEKIEQLSKELNNHDFDLFSYVENAKNIPYRGSAALIRYKEEKEDFYVFSYFILNPFLHNYKGFSLYRTLLENYAHGISGQRKMYSLVKPSKEDTADYYFSTKAEELMKEVQLKLDLLRSYGVSEMVLQELFESSTKISRLEITKAYKIFLPDYNNMEIKLEPLNKAVFILFLKHNEGILFKHLVDYREELEEIYSKVIGQKCEEKHKESIAAICDPTKNSINEKCARIREAFISKFDERLAKNYFVTGERGEVKRITLSRELVEWE